MPGPTTLPAINFDQLLTPPREWFHDVPVWADAGWPGIQVDESGRVYLRVADWDQCLLDGREWEGSCWTAPQSPSAYAAAMTSPVIYSDGTTERASNIGGGIDHHNPFDVGRNGFQRARDHYANSASQAIQLRYYEDDKGVYGIGSVWPHVSATGVQYLRRLSVSGDWRPDWDYGGRIDMAGAQLVGTPALAIKPENGMAMVASMAKRIEPLVRNGRIVGAIGKGSAAASIGGPGKADLSKLLSPAGRVARVAGLMNDLADRLGTDVINVTHAPSLESSLTEPAACSCRSSGHEHASDIANASAH